MDLSSAIHFFLGGGVLTENQEQLQILLTIYDLK